MFSVWKSKPVLALLRSQSPKKGGKVLACANCSSTANLPFRKEVRQKQQQQNLLFWPQKPCVQRNLATNKWLINQKAKKTFLWEGRIFFIQSVNSRRLYCSVVSVLIWGRSQWKWCACRFVQQWGETQHLKISPNKQQTVVKIMQPFLCSSACCRMKTCSEWQCAALDPPPGLETAVLDAPWDCWGLEIHWSWNQQWKAVFVKMSLAYIC